MGVTAWLIPLMTSIIQGSTTSCESLKASYQAHPFNYVLSTDLPVHDEVIAGVSTVRIGDFDVPFPESAIETIAISTRDESPGLIAIKFEPDGHSMMITRNEVPTNMLTSGHSYFGLLAHAYSLTPDDIDCASDEHALKRDLVAFLLKGLQFPISNTRSEERVYLTRWGLLRTGGVDEDGNQIWVANYIQAYNESLEFIWRMPAQFRSIGLATLNAQSAVVSDAIMEIAVCIEQWSYACFLNLKHSPVKELGSVQDT